MSSTRKIRVGLVGFGISGRVFHAPFLHRLSDQYELKCVVERHANEAEKIYPSIRTVRSSNELFLDPDIDLVVITTENHSHYSLSKEALEHGKHVVVEKPMTITSVEARHLLELAKSKHLIICPYHNRRYTSGFRTIEAIVREKLLGNEIIDCEIHFDRYRPELKAGNAWRERREPGAGIFFDLGSHLIDQALTLFGQPTTITADIRQQRTVAFIDDYFDVRLDYGRLRVTLKASMLVRESGPRYTLHGTRGSFIKYGDDIQEEMLRAGAMPPTNDEKVHDRQWGNESSEYDGILHTEDSDGQIVKKKYSTLRGDYGLFYEQLYRAIIDGQPLNIRPEDGFNVIRLIELGFQSSNEKRTVICEQLL
jgi:scyllo-inositol 2-dehydrogenase (NADP+)